MNSKLYTVLMQTENRIFPDIKVNIQHLIEVSDDTDGKVKSDEDKSSKWKAIKEKLKGSLRFKSSLSKLSLYTFCELW